MRFVVTLGFVLLGLASCGANIDRSDRVFSAQEQAQFLSVMPERGDRVDALIAARKPRPAAGRNVGAAAARADLAFAFATVERVHPSYWLAFGGQAGYEAWKVRAGRWLDHLTAGNEISRSDLSLVLAYALAGFEDGHTGFPLYGRNADDLTAVPVVPPWTLVWKGDRWFVGGSELRLLNGRPPAETLEPVLLAVSGETPAWRSTLASRLLVPYLRMTDPFAGVTRFRAELADGRILEGPPGERWRFEADQASVGGDEPAGRLPFTDLGGGLGLYDYRSFDASQGGLAAMDEVFRQASAAGTTDLIVDLRANGGGSSNAGEALLGHVTDQPFRQFRTIVARWSKESAAAAGRRDWWLPGPPLGSWSREELTAEPAVPRPPRLKARLHLLVGPFTFSSASDFAMTVLDYGLGDLWGYETGGVRTCAGDLLPFSFPASGMDFSVSWKVFFGPKPAAGESRHGALPNHPATAEALNPFLGDPDPELAWVMAGLRPASAP